jgi:hypothetical protein
MDVASLSKGDFTITQETDQNARPVPNSYVVNPNNPTGQLISGAGDDLYAVAKGRYMASQRTKDNLYILSEMPEGNGLLVWNKEKGEISRKITFADITPQFVVDEATDRVYVIVGNVIKAYNLQ